MIASPSLPRRIPFDAAWEWADGGFRRIYDRDRIVANAIAQQFQWAVDHGWAHQGPGPLRQFETASSPSQSHRCNDRSADNTMGEPTTETTTMPLSQPIDENRLLEKQMADHELSARLYPPIGDQTHVNILVQYEQSIGAIDHSAFTHELYSLELAEQTVRLNLISRIHFEVIQLYHQIRENIICLSSVNQQRYQPRADEETMDRRSQTMPAVLTPCATQDSPLLPYLPAIPARVLNGTHSQRISTKSNDSPIWNTVPRSRPQQYQSLPRIHTRPL